MLNSYNLTKQLKQETRELKSLPVLVKKYLAKMNSIGFSLNTQEIIYNRKIKY